MPPHISVRDIAFSPEETIVTIVVTTDIPCHLYARLTTKEPHIHKKAVIIRGLPMQDDVRFCFTVFEDNEQDEAGDTLTHTFTKPNWPVCTTKWLYLWGYVAGTISPSTSPFFRFHNSWEAPVPVVDIMYTFNAIEPELHACGGGDQWNTIDLSHDIPPDATGVIVKLINTAAAQDEKCGLRKPGTWLDTTGYLWGGGHQWGLCGINAAREIEVYGHHVGFHDLWVLGYTGRNVHFLDNPVDLTPPNSLVWQDLDCSPHIPSGAIPIFDFSYGGYAIKRYAVRPKGGTFAVWGYASHNWVTIATDVNGIVEVYMEGVGVLAWRTVLVGYIVGASKFHNDPIDITPAITGSWQTVPVSLANTDSLFAILEVGNADPNVLHGVRKKDSLRDSRHRAHGHSWVYAHVDLTPALQIYRPTADFLYYEWGVTI